MPPKMTVRPGCDLPCYVAEGYDHVVDDGSAQAGEQPFRKVRTRTYVLSSRQRCS